ncbi:TPA: YadA-like family protein [Morganella morganii subsp. morganii]|uniref:Trimeric autotransporter adhesin YadA-like C-terminal membrane anchor domain-containing protein n=1 Tax=Morganella morganii TaxID=582 RepID=A0AAU8ZIB7_MORMO|nr:YadA C-terminal domain-containing protein [Morganella morganii]AWC92822.1 hypothetical protein AM380_03750 [Morganella morganii]EKW8487007.1 YadA-like family protein [Morganella morganii]HAT3623999.1 hypothetical protein [Morganella morganii]HDU8692248.1 YadA-like family protein [Morganella morganii subsp. morganii]
MKKSILALIISPLFIHAANAAYTDVISLPLSKEIGAPLFHFSENKAEGDREVGISELRQVTERIGTYLSENYEYIDSAREDIKNNVEKGVKKDIAESIATVSDQLISDVKEKTIPAYIDSVLPDKVKNQVSQQLVPIYDRTESLEEKTRKMDDKLNIIRSDLQELPDQFAEAMIKPIEEFERGIAEPFEQQKKQIESAKIVTSAIMDATNNLETDVDKLKNKVLAVELQAGFAKQSAYTSEKDIRENKNQLSAQSRDIAQNKKLLESAKVVTSAITDATLALEADVAKMDTRISNASKKAGTALNVANQNTKSIDGQKVKVEKNTLDILKNRQDLRSLEKDLRETNERLDNGLAASAALNGLFQPYGVGKLNITAAVGGYQSTQAVAVGTGYRFNENIAVKTGMAYTGSNDVMYNMAFNLEW